MKEMKKNPLKIALKKNSMKTFMKQRLKHERKMKLYCKTKIQQKCQ